MRKRVAFLATCVSLVCCIAFTAIYARATLNNLTVTATNDLLRLCRMSAEYLDTAAFFAYGSDELRKLAQSVDVGLTVIDENDTVLYNTSKAADPQKDAQGEDIALARANGSGTDIRPFRETRTIFASVLTDGGVVVRLWRAAPRMYDAYAGHGLEIAALGVVLIALCYLLASLSAEQSERVVEGSQRLLEAFAEGRFDERIENVHGKSALWCEKINGCAERIEEQLRRQGSRNQALSVVMNQMQNGILAVNSDLEVILMTPVAKALLGVHEPWEKVPVTDLSRDVNLEPVFREAMAQDGVYTNEVAVREGTTGRGKKPLRLYVSPMRQDGQTVGAVAMVEDITELRRLERMRTDFTANVSHELKTPLTSIKGFVETLLDGAVDNPAMARKFLNIIMMEADRLTRLVNDILSISKLESGDTEVSLGRQRLDKMANDVCEMLKIHAREKEIDLSINENGEPIYVWGNQDRVEQLLINLIENAIKYNQPGGSVRVSVYGTEQNAYLLVSDTGIGIAEEHLPRLFERFYRVDKGRSRSMGGTGLGLAIVKHIVVSMGGTIEVHSKLGEGTEFSVTLPRYFTAESEQEEPREEENEV